MNPASVIGCPKMPFNRVEPSGARNKPMIMSRKQEISASQMKKVLFLLSLKKNKMIKNGAVLYTYQLNAFFKPSIDSYEKKPDKNIDSQNTEKRPSQYRESKMFLNSSELEGTLKFFITINIATKTDKPKNVLATAIEIH